MVLLPLLLLFYVVLGWNPGPHVCYAGNLQTELRLFSLLSPVTRSQAPTAALKLAILLDAAEQEGPEGGWLTVRNKRKLCSTPFLPPEPAPILPNK